MAGNPNPWEEGGENPYSSTPRQTSQTYYQNQPNTYQRPRNQNPAPGVDPGWNVNATGTNKNWWDTSAQEAGIDAWSSANTYRNDPNMSQKLAAMSPEQRARWSMEHIDDLGGGGKQTNPEQAWRQWMYWQDSFDPSCPPAAPYRAEDGSGCVEKPDNSNNPSSQVAPQGPGPRQLRKMGMTREQYNAQNPGNYPTGANTPAGSGSSPGDLALYQVKQQYAEALADPTGQKAWQLFTGQGGEKTFQDTMDKMTAQIAGMPDGPARQYAEQQLREMQTNMRIQLPQQARAASIAGLQGVIAPELGYVGSERDRKLQQFIANTNRDLGFANVGLGQQGLNLSAQNQAWNQNVMFPWQVAQAGAGNFLNQYGTDAQINAANQQANAGAVGGLLNQGIGLGMDWLRQRQQASGGTNVSDIRAKEDIAPGRRGLTDLLKLKTHTYRYKGTPKITQSVMAQDLEKIAPEFVVEDPSGLKMVDSYGLLGMTMQAVKELAKKVEKS